MPAIRLRVGTYAKAGGMGLYALDYDTQAGFSLGEPLEAASNASYGAWSARHGVHYLVDEQAMGALGCYRIVDGVWHAQGRVPTEGREPCYVALDPDETHLAVANYGSGSVALFELAPDGTPYEEAAALWANTGTGPNAARHVHCARFSPDGRWLYAVDLGTDRVLRFALDAATPLEAAHLAYQAPAGSGPRHLLFHPSEPVALLVSELASTLSVLDASAEGLSLRACVSTLPPGSVNDSLGGHLAINAAGDRAYVTNRGDDSIAVFRLDAATRTVEALQHQPSGAASPRFLLLLETMQRAIVAHEQGGTVSAFAIEDDGTLRDTGHRIGVPGSAFLTAEFP